MSYVSGEQRKDSDYSLMYTRSVVLVLKNKPLMVRGVSGKIKKTAYLARGIMNTTLFDHDCNSLS